MCNNVAICRCPFLSFFSNLVQFFACQLVQLILLLLFSLVYTIFHIENPLLSYLSSSSNKACKHMQFDWYLQVE